MTKTPNFHYEISFPDFDSSDAIKAYIEKYLLKLEQVFDRIISCHIAVRAPHKHQKKPNYHISIHLEIPGKDIIVNQQPTNKSTGSDIHLAIRDAFRALRRQLREQTNVRKEKRDQPNTHQQATVKSYDPNQGYGFLTGIDGREVYFHKNSLINGNPSNLKSGLKVRYIEQPGEKGSHVTSMSILGEKNHQK